MSNTRCYVVDDENNIIIFRAEVLCQVSSEMDCKLSSFVVIKYYKNEIDSLDRKNPIYKIIPIESAYFFKGEGL
jgi:hypothetical protein